MQFGILTLMLLDETQENVPIATRGTIRPHTKNVKRICITITLSSLRYAGDMLIAKSCLFFVL